MPTSVHPLRRTLAALTSLLLVVSLLVLGGPSAPAAAAGVGPEVVFDDMEHANPFGNGWFAFGSASGGGGIDPNLTDLPPNDGGTASLQAGWGGAPGFYGGFGRTNPVDLTDLTTFNFWINPDAGQGYTLEINLQEDDTGDGDEDDEFQFNCVVSATGPCAVAGGGWQFVSIPLADFFDDNTVLPGGNGELDAISVTNGGNGELVNIVIAVIGDGNPANFRTDYWSFSQGRVLDNFENGLPFGSAVPDGEPLGFYTFQGDGSVAITTSSPATPLPAAGTPNAVLQVDVDVSSFAGYIHAFENLALDAWVTDDWSTSEGISFWMLGTNSGTQMFIDILDNRSEGSTVDDAERWTVPFADDFIGWQLLEFPFASFVRKEIGNGAPNDGLGLFEMHGYAIGTLGTGGPQQFLIDDVALYGIGEPPALAVNFSQQNTFVEEGVTGQVGVKLNRPMGPDDPAQISIDFATERSNATELEEFTPTSGTLTFVNGGATELFFPIETFDDTKFEGDEQVVIRLTNPVDVERGALFQGSVLIDDNDPVDPDVIDEFTQGAYLWDIDGPATIDRVRVADGDDAARPEQDAFEDMAYAEVPLSVDVEVKGNLCRPPRGIIPVELLSTPDFDATAVDVSTVTLGDATEVHVNRRTGEPRRHVDDVNGDGRDDLILHFRAADVGVDCLDEIPFNGTTDAGQAFTAGGSEAALVRDFPLGQDWTGTESVSFWYRGAGGGEDVTVTLKDNRAPDPGPVGWDMVWSDEFDEPAGTPPDPENWMYEIGDTTPDGKNGWGNEEKQYYTDDPKNAATDGDGNLVITLDEAAGTQECYYGPCEFESARLLTQHRAEFAYGRIESRLRVPDGAGGLWPAFWSLGTDITSNPWPGAGEIDFMEYVSRLPNEIFGTIHGPGYNGGGSFNGIYDFGEPVYNDYHTFTVEWQPNLITWYVDGIQYHEAEPSDVPGPWVFEKPYFLLLNFAIGGNFGGAIDPGIAYPQEYLVDYVRVYQGPDTSERFEATFTDDVAGWRQVTVPITDFARSAEQPTGAPDDGLTLTDVWGVGLELSNGNAAGELWLDAVRRVPEPPPSELAVTSTAGSGDGSLREALAAIADGGTITVDPSLAGETIDLGGQQLTINRSVTIDASAAPGLTLDAMAASRVLQVQPGADVAINDVVITGGAAAPRGGGILNLGSLRLERVAVSGNTQTAAGPASFDLGGGGIFNGDGAVLVVTESTVSGNTSTNQPGGGIYGFFNSDITIERSTISGNVAGDVAGGLRTLGNATIIDSTISGNVSSAWHGGALFATDGTVTITNSTIVGNTAPGGTAGGLMVATFGAPVDVFLTNTVIADNGSYNCQVEGDPGVAVLTSLGGNVSTDGSCATDAAGDQVVGAFGALLGGLADNGGPTLTHLPGASSPVLDAADAARCSATDQRGVPRPQGAGCDVGSVEVVP